MGRIWVIPGAPLERGEGWRIWYSAEGQADFRPTDPTVARGDAAEAVTTSWRLLPAMGGIARRMGILTVRLNKPDPGMSYTVTVPEAQAPTPFTWKTLADFSPVDPPEAAATGPLLKPVTFMLSSCFWRGNDKDGHFASAVQTLSKIHDPAFKLLVGDQVYQDWPVTFVSFKTPTELYASRYDEYWGDEKHQQLLQSCPNFFMCDDHEFWNDYPERQPHLERTYTEGSRKEYGDAARATYEYYQRVCNPGDKPWYRFDVGRVSFFVADTRSERTMMEPDDQSEPHFFSKGQWEAVRRWARRLRGPGVLVLGQPLYQADGNWKDHSLSNFQDDYVRLCDLIRDTIETGFEGGERHDILMLSGDIHSGRYCVRTLATRDGRGVTVPELIASSSSRILPGSADPEWAPSKMTVEAPGRAARWAGQAADDLATIDNNVAVVKMSEGTAGRVRFEMAVWRVRPFDARGFWEKKLGTARPEGPVMPLFRREVELG